MLSKDIPSTNKSTVNWWDTCSSGDLHLIHQYRFSQLISILAKVQKNSATGEVDEIDQLAESFRTNRCRTVGGAARHLKTHLPDVSLSFSSPTSARTWRNPQHHTWKMWPVDSTCQSEAMSSRTVATHSGSKSCYLVRILKLALWASFPVTPTSTTVRILQEFLLRDTVSFRIHLLRLPPQNGVSWMA